MEPDPPLVGTVVTRHAALFNQMEARLTDDFNQKINQMQETILATMAAQQQQPEPQPAKGKCKKRQSKATKKPSPPPETRMSAKRRK